MVQMFLVPIPAFLASLNFFFSTAGVECHCFPPVRPRLRLQIPAKLLYKHKLNLASAVITSRFCGRMKEMHPFPTPFFQFLPMYSEFRVSSNVFAT